MSNTMFSKLKKRDYITEKQLKRFSHEYRKATNFGKLYFLPKIHKSLHNVPGLPVISYCCTPTENCSEFLDHHLKILMQKRWSYIKDSGDFIKETRNLGSIPENVILVTGDVEGLYPNIPHEAGLKALRRVLDKREQHTIPTSKLIRVADFVLKNNYFDLDGQIKQQISGTAISTKFAPPYACLFMNKIETAFLETQELQPLVLFRYIDDIFFIWARSEQELQTFLRSLNELHTGIKFTYEPSKESIAFLDLKVSFKNSKIITDLYVKSTDRHQYLHYLSAHPKHTKQSVVLSQTLRISRLSSYEESFMEHKANMKSWFLKTEYPEGSISAKMDKVKFSNIERKSNSKTQNGIPLVVIYHTLLKSLSSIVNNNIYLLHMDQEDIYSTTHSFLQKCA